MGGCLVAVWWLRRFAVATARAPHARADHAQTKHTCARNARALCVPLRQRNVDSTATLRNVAHTLPNDVVESTLR
eukprot:7540164-Lingulodinium_polyedra.AAC.1